MGLLQIKSLKMFLLVKKNVLILLKDIILIQYFTSLQYNNFVYIELDEKYRERYSSYTVGCGVPN